MAVINDWIKKQLQVTFFNTVIDDLMWGSDRLCYRWARIWITGGATQLCIYNQYQLLNESAINKHVNDVINSQKQCGENQLRCFMASIIRISLMNVHATVSTTVCKALVSFDPSFACLPSLLSQAVYKTGNEGCHLSHLCGVHRGTFCTVLACLTSPNAAQMFRDLQ